GGQRTAPRPQRRHARRRARAACHLHPGLLSPTDQPVGEHGLAHPGLAKQQYSPAIASPTARQGGGKLGLLTVAADDRHVGGQVHAHTQPHALLTAQVCSTSPRWQYRTGCYIGCRVRRSSNVARSTCQTRVSTADSPVRSSLAALSTESKVGIVPSLVL